MKSFVRIGTCLIALGVAGLLAGCASHRSPGTAQRAARDFEVVETNSKHLLTPQEMEHLRHEVAKFLEKEGAVASGDYYVKIFLAPDKDGLSTEWVVVRFTRDTEMRYSLLGSYAANSYNYQSYASYNYYPYGYDNFGRISFQYYADPFYGSHYYFPPRSRHNRDRDRDHDRDRDKDRDSDHSPSPERAKFKPIPAVESPQVTRTRRDGNSGERNDQSGDNNFRHRTRTPGRPAERNRDPATSSTDRSESPRNESSARNEGNRTRDQGFPRHGGAPVGQTERSAEYRRDSGSATPVRSEAPARSESVSRSSSTYTPTASRPESSQSSSRSEPSYSAPARSESSSRSTESNQSQKESNQAADQRQRLE